jgi:translation elongation factor EF-4
MSSLNCSIVYELPLAEMVGNFFDQLQSRSKGYTSIEYSVVGYCISDLIKPDIPINVEPIEAIAAIVHKDKASSIGQALTQKLKDHIPHQLFKIPIQARIGAKVVASEALPAIRKDVLAMCYGGDISRKKKLLKKADKTNEICWKSGSSLGSFYGSIETGERNDIRISSQIKVLSASSWITEEYVEHSLLLLKLSPSGKSPNPNGGA